MPADGDGPWLGDEVGDGGGAVRDGTAVDAPPEGLHDGVAGALDDGEGGRAETDGEGDAGAVLVQGEAEGLTVGEGLTAGVGAGGGDPVRPMVAALERMRSADARSPPDASITAMLSNLGNASFTVPTIAAVCASVAEAPKSLDAAATSSPTSLTALTARSPRCRCAIASASLTRSEARLSSR